MRTRVSHSSLLDWAVFCESHTWSWIRTLFPGNRKEVSLPESTFDRVTTVANSLFRSTVYLTGNYIGIFITIKSCCPSVLTRIFLEQSPENDLSPFGSELGSEMDSEDGYDLREVSSDVEMHPDDLADVDSDARWVFVCLLPSIEF